MPGDGTLELKPEIGDLSADGLRYWDGDVWQWQPLWLTPDEVASAARTHFSRSVTAVLFLASGLLNQSWWLSTDDGAYVLRVGRPERSLEQVGYEHAFTRELAKHVKVVVPPLLGLNGESIQQWRGRIVSMFPFVEGVSGADLKANGRDYQTAVVLAQIHRASLDHVRFGQRPGFRSVNEHPRWVWPDVKPILRRHLDGTDDFDDLCHTLDRAIAELDAWLDDPGVARRLIPRATIHGDFNPRNLIFRGGRIAAAVDWDECRVEPLAWEVAQVGLGTSDIDPFAFWRAYLDARGPLDPRDVDLLGGFARMGALSELRWTVKDGNATPHAIEQVRGVAAALAWLRDRAAGLPLA